MTFRIDRLATGGTLARPRRRACETIQRLALAVGFTLVAMAFVVGLLRVLA